MRLTAAICACRLRALLGVFCIWLSGEPRARSGQCHLTYMYDKAEA